MLYLGLEVANKKKICHGSAIRRPRCCRVAEIDYQKPPWIQEQENESADEDDDDGSYLDYDHNYHQHYYQPRQPRLPTPPPPPPPPSAPLPATFHTKISHVELLRSDSGNSSLNTIDSISNSSSSNESSKNTHPDARCSLYGGTESTSFVEDDLLFLLNIFVPETHNDFDITCSARQSIWSVKKVLIEHCQEREQLRDLGLNHGLFNYQLACFLDEQFTFADYFWNNHHRSPVLDLQSSQRSSSVGWTTVIKLEFRYKQRVRYGEIMSTLPLASATRKKRKRSRLLSAIQNCNVDKLAKALVNCDPNFVDEQTGETPLSLAASLQTPQSNVLQQIIVGIVNGGALLDFRTKDGRTALHVAVQRSNFVALKTLLDLGASPNYLDAQGLTPLYYSVIYKANPKLTQLLLYEHATHGISDQHGWQEVHQASKLGLVQHLEQLLFYGCDMNCRIAGSGNTPLHVAAINDQVECARILLLRGCDTTVVNNSHQNAYQVSVIANNMALADFIQNHKQENVVPYRDKPRFNPARRPQNSFADTPSGKKPPMDINGGGGGQLNVRSISPSLSQLTNTTSSGVCCDDEDQQQTKRPVMMNSANSENAQPESTGYDDEDGDEEEEEETANGGMPSSESEDSTAFAPGMMVKAISDYNSGDPSHMQLRRNDHVLLLHSDQSPPTIASQKLLLGRRCLDGQEGFFPACCVEKIKPLKDTDDRVEGRRDMKLKNNMQAATLPTRGRRGARKCYLDKSNTRQYQDRTVVLHRGTKGFGFVLRGAKDSSPIFTKQMLQQQGPAPLIGLQYFDEIEAGGVADAAGLKRGDFLLAVNDVDVRHMSHENVVQLIRQSGDKVTMTIATPVPKQLVSILKKKPATNTGLQSQKTTPPPPPPPIPTSSSDLDKSLPPPPPEAQLPPPPVVTSSQMQMSQSVYASFATAGTGTGTRGTKAPPPAPPKRDPSTTLSTSRARARSLVVASEVRTAHNQAAFLLLNEAKTAVDDKPETTQKASPDTSLRSKTSRRISSYELNSVAHTQDEINKPKTTGEGAPAKPERQTTDKQNSVLSPPVSPLHSMTKTQENVANGSEPASGQQPQIPEPDYSSDEDASKKPAEKTQKQNAETQTPVKSSTLKFTSKATVVLKSTSPCPPDVPAQTNGAMPKGMFEELKEQSAKTISAARLRFAAENGDVSVKQSSSPNNVRKNVAEFEKRLVGGVQADQNQQLRMSKSCMEEFSANVHLQKKDLAKHPQLRQKTGTEVDANDLRRNSAIISAIAEKVAAVNQLVAEQQQQGGSKSLNSSPVPTSMLAKLQQQPGSTVVVQKPIAMLAGGNAGGSSTLTRRCVTVCEDPVKAIHLQQQHQQLRSQLTAQVLNKQQQIAAAATAKHSSLAEVPGSILKQSTAAKRQINQQYGATTAGPADVVPPPPEFAASTPPIAVPTNARSQQAQQKIYMQRQQQLQQVTSPLTIGTQQHAHHHHHHQHDTVGAAGSVGQPAPLSQHYSHQATHYHLHHNHGATLSSSAPTDGHNHSLMRMIPAASGSTNYDYVAQQQNPRGLHQQPIYVQQASSQQSSTTLQNQLLMQQRAALAAANAKLYQQQLGRCQVAATGSGSQPQQYHTLASAKPQQQPVQYYIATTSQAPGQSPQYFATLSRHQHAQVQQQYLQSLTSQQQQMQQQQFATLTRHHQQQLQQQMQQQQGQTISGYQPQQQQRIQQSAQQRIPIQNVNRQTPPTAVSGGKIVAAHPYNLQQQYQQFQSTPPQPVSASYMRKSVVEWTPDDVQEWLQRIGMAEHRINFETFNGAKMLRLDNNSLANIGVRQQQHRIYILEKLKQQIWQSHQ